MASIFVEGDLAGEEVRVTFCFCGGFWMETLGLYLVLWRGLSGEEVGVAPILWWKGFGWRRG